MLRSDSLKLALACAAAVLGMVLLLAAPAWNSNALLHGRMLSVHLLLELFAVVIAALIVTVSWHTFDRRDDRTANALVAGFLIVATCDLMHALSYKGMPDLLAESSTPRAIFYWLMGRSAEVLTLGLIALDRVPRVSRRVSLASGALLAAALVGFGSYALDLFPATFVDGAGVTAFKAGYEYALCALNLLLALLLRQRAVREGSRQLTMLALASFVMGVGGLAFTAYVAPSDIQNIVGHVYKVAAYALLYRATFITSIRAPYEALRASEAQVRESQARMDTLGANLPQSVLYQVMRDFDGTMRFTQVSAAIERVNGLLAADVLRDPTLWYGQIHPDDLSALSEAERRSAETMQLFDCEARLRRTDGSLRRMHLVSAPRRLADGRIVWDGIQTDITERSEAQAAQRLLELQLREAQKMESIGTLASGIAHDFNNVLGAILGNAALARGDLQRGVHADALQAIDQINKAGERARDLVRQILTFSRRQAPARLAQPVQPIVEDSLSLLRSTLPANVEVALRLDDAHACAEVDRTQIEQVILNLCTNAWHALGEDGGRIEIGLALQTVNDDGPAGLAPGPYVQLWIADNGCGMDEATQRRVFEPFFTTKPVGHGTGLGLSVVHGIVQAHGGTIRLASAPGRGTRFDIYVPALAAQAAAEPAAATADAVTAGRGEHVLYLDDDEVMSLMVERLLQRAGYRVTCCTDTRAAIDAVREHPGRFDVLVTDYNMPGHSGLEVVRQVARLQPPLPVVLSSGSMSDELRAKARELGVFDVVEKQSTLETLGPAIERALERAAQASRTRHPPPRLRVVR